MHHLHIDRYANMTSPVHRMDPRVKTATMLSFILLVVMTPERHALSFTLYGFMLFGVIRLSRVPLGYLIRRALLLVPFAFAVSVFVPFTMPGETIWQFTLFGRPVTVTDEGLIRFGAINAKAALSFAATFTLAAATRFGDLMWAAARLGMPAKLVLIISFMYRYLFILLDTATHMKLARDLRSSGHSAAAMTIASGNIIGALFVRSYDHAQALYDAMLLRGYTGHPVRQGGQPLTVRDIAAALAFVLAGGAAAIGGGLLHG